MPSLPPEICLTVLGSGTCVPRLDRSACSLLVVAAGTTLLLDCGPGTMRRLLEAGTTVFDIDAVFLSHFHPDHSGELVSFLFANKYPDGTRRVRPLTLIGGRGTARFFEGLKDVYGKWIALDDALFHLVELATAGPDQTQVGQLQLRSAPVAHNPESVALRLTSPAGPSVVYSGDTDFSESLIDLAQGTDVLVCECALPDGLKVAGHLTPAQAGTIAAQAGVGRLVLTHFYPECDAADVVGQCRQTWAGSLDLAFDLMRIDV